MEEIAAAMAETDEAVASELNDIPTFDFDMDIFGSDTVDNNPSTRQATSRDGAEENVQQRAETFRPKGGSVTSLCAGKIPAQSVARSSVTSSSSASVCSRDSETRTKPAQPQSNHRTDSCKVIPASRKSNGGVTSTVTSFLSNQQQACPADIKPSPMREPQRPNSSSAAVLSPLLVSPDRNRDKLVVLVDSREISNCQIMSILRLKHNIKAVVSAVNSADYIVSNRMAVERKRLSDVSSSANGSKLIERMRLMCELYDRPCLIIEKDRLKPGEKPKSCARSKYLDSVLACLSQTHIKVLFSESQEETAQLLADLAAREAKKSAAITAPTSLKKEAEQAMKVLLSIPKVNYVLALNLCSSLQSLHQIINSSPADLQRKVPSLSILRAREIFKFFHRNFDENMTS